MPFSCVDKDKPPAEEVLDLAGTTNIVAFEYGINIEIPNTQDGELLAPAIQLEMVVILRYEEFPETEEVVQILSRV